MITTQQVTKKVRQYKKLSFFNRLKLLIAGLTEAEKSRIIRYLNWPEPAYKPEPKISILFKYLLQNPEAEETIASEIVETRKRGSFKSLVKRLTDKIGYCLTNETSTQGQECLYSKRTQAESEIFHKLFRANLYVGAKNLPEEGYLLYKQVEKLAAQYEFYFPLLQALYTIRSYLKLRKGTKGHATITDRIRHYEKCLRFYLRGWEEYEEFNSNMIYDGYRVGIADKFRKAIAELEEGYNETRSDNVAYFLYYIKIGCLSESKQFAEANKYAQKFFDLVRESPAVYMPHRMGIAYGVLADTYIYCGEFEKSFEALQGARKYLYPNSLNYSLSEELEFWALFYSAQYEKAEQKIRSILTNKKYKQSPYLLNKRRYLHACVLFVVGDYTRCANILETIEEIQEDIKGWNIGIKTLSILRAIAGREHEELTILKIRAFQYEIDKLKELKAARDRDILILNLLNKLVKSNCDFKGLYKKRIADFELLEQDDTEYSWSIGSHELIIFHRWFKCMMARQPYKVDLSQEKKVESVLS